MSTQNIDNPQTLEDWNFILNLAVNPFGKGRLTEQNIKDIETLNGDINLLYEHGITADNYRAKVKSYFNFRDKALKEYGIELSSLYPFKNPTHIFRKIHIMLNDAELNEEQIKRFYGISKVRTRRPKQADIDDALTFHNTFNFQVDKSSVGIDEKSEQMQENEWDALSSAEQRIILGISDEENEKEHQEQEEIDNYMKEYNLKKQQLKQKFKRIQHKNNLS